ncbi:SOS response-associated peptidase, partial [Nostoc sp. NIES-2111]
VTPQVLQALFGYEDEHAFPPRETISPTEPIGIVADVDGRRRFMLVRWGFLPSWVKDPGDFPLLFNARAETAADKPAFRNAIRRRRCLVPADGFFEWRRSGTGRNAVREPFLVRRRDGMPMAMGGVWETWAGADGSEIDTAAILTTAANGTVAAIHDRMPVIVEPADFAAWLDPHEDDPAVISRMLRPAADDVIELMAVDRGRPRPLPPGSLSGVRKGAGTAVKPEPEPPPSEPEQGSLF